MGAEIVKPGGKKQPRRGWGLIPSRQRLVALDDADLTFVAEGLEAFVGVHSPCTSCDSPAPPRSARTSPQAARTSC